jgi:AcrR family transcriptional regulator
MIYNKNSWIEKGYEIFSVSGLNGLKVEALSKKVGISKSSFYHHFADVDLFIEQLLHRFIQQSHIIAEKELACQNINPELIRVLVDHKTDLLFSRQLRINRERKMFNDVLNLSNQLVGNSFGMVWVKELNLRLSDKQLQAIFELALENFFLQISAENLTEVWLCNYFNNLKRIANNFN